MNQHELFSDSICGEQTRVAERELSSFIAAVKELYGPVQAGLAAEDWLEELDLVDSSRRSEAGDCRAATIAASVRLASRLTGANARASIAQRIAG